MTVGHGISVWKSMRGIALVMLLFPTAAVVLLWYFGAGTLQVAAGLMLTALCIVPFLLVSYRIGPTHASWVIFLREGVAPRLLPGGGLAMLWAGTTGTQYQNFIGWLWLSCAVTVEIVGWASARRAQLHELKKTARRKRIFRVEDGQVILTSLSDSICPPFAAGEERVLRILFPIIVILGSAAQLRVFSSQGVSSSEPLVAILFGMIQVFLYPSIREGWILRRAIWDIEANGPEGWVHRPRKTVA